MLVFEERGKLEFPEKNLSEQSKEPTNSKPTYDAGSGNRTRDTLVEGECSHHCTNPAPLHDLVTWYRINYAGMQVTQWNFQNKEKSGWTGSSSFVLKVPLYKVSHSDKVVKLYRTVCFVLMQTLCEHIRKLSISELMPSVSTSR